MSNRNGIMGDNGAVRWITGISYHQFPGQNGPDLDVSPNVIIHNQFRLINLHLLYCIEHNALLPHSSSGVKQISDWTICNNKECMLWQFKLRCSGFWTIVNIRRWAPSYPLYLIRLHLGNLVNYLIQTIRLQQRNWHWWQKPSIMY